MVRFALCVGSGNMFHKNAWIFFAGMTFELCILVYKFRKIEECMTDMWWTIPLLFGIAIITYLGREK